MRHWNLFDYFFIENNGKFGPIKSNSKSIIFICFYFIINHNNLMKKLILTY